MPYTNATKSILFSGVPTYDESGLTYDQAGMTYDGGGLGYANSTEPTTSYANSSLATTSYANVTKPS